VGKDLDLGLMKEGERLLDLPFFEVGEDSHANPVMLRLLFDTVDEFTSFYLFPQNFSVPFGVLLTIVLEL